MLDHISIGVRDLARSKRFYDAVLAPLGYRCLREKPGQLGYGDGNNAAFWVMETDHPVPADDRSGLHICFVARSRGDVEAFHAAGLSHGGQDNGEPGLRPEYNANYYAAFVRDPDGYRVEAHTQV